MYSTSSEALIDSGFFTRFCQTSAHENRVVLMRVFMSRSMSQMKLKIVARLDVCVSALRPATAFSLQRLGKRASILSGVGVILCLFTGTVQAEKRIELYNVSQLVLDQSVGLRQQATTAGLAMVIVKVSGRRQALDHPLVKYALTASTDYLAQYSYGSTDETLTIVGDSRPAQRLILQFSASAIQSLLQAAQLPTWPDNRPEILLWLVSDKSVSGVKTKRLLDAQSEEVLAMKAAGTIRGLPIAMPLLDLRDRQKLSPARLWAMDESTIRHASSRYGSDGVLAGRLTAVSNNLWKASVILVHKEKRLYFSSEAPTSSLAAQQIIDQAANYFSGLDAVVVNDESSAPSMIIAVNDVSSFGAYASLLKYLADLPSIVNTMVSHVNGDQLTLELSYNGSSAKLLSLLAASDLMLLVASVTTPITPLVVDEPLVPAIDPAVSVDTPVEATFAWRGLGVN
ncbi:MAG: hypothetical protein ACI9NY_000405 [Kiritimatiellia bacterium]